MAERKRAGGMVAVVRTRIAQLIWLVAVLCALLLATGALLVALDANTGNPLVEVVLDAADALGLGVFTRANGIFTFDGTEAATKSALANWGLGAITYLIVGRILDRVVRG